MGHQYRIREIALQAGLSEATVDRVLNQRGGVRASTVQEVHQAIADLDRQYTQLRLGGRTSQRSGEPHSILRPSDLISLPNFS